MEKNRVTTYLLYAVGEIILVVIGILIAVSLNNWNSKKTAVAKANGHLKSIQNDLLEDINFIYHNLSIYAKRDSLFHLYFSIDTADWRNYQRAEFEPIHRVNMHLWPISLRNKGYSQLLTLNDQLPEPYSDLLESLTFHYTTLSDFFYRPVETFEEIVNEEYTDINTKHWYYQWRNSEDSESEDPNSEFVKYALTDPIRRNRVASYHKNLITDYYLGTMDYLRNATRLYLEIATFLGQNEIPERVKMKPIESAAHAIMLGVFKGQSNEIKLADQNGQLVCILNSDTIPLFDYQHNTWIGERSYTYLLLSVLDENNLRRGLCRYESKVYKRISEPTLD